MYVHAYQSYIWNLVVSERIKLSPTEPLAGDLVIVPEETDKTVGKSTQSYLVLLAFFTYSFPLHLLLDSFLTSVILYIVQDD